MFRRNSKANKAKLEHKLCVAKDTPEPIFDLSECDIQDVPNGIYSLCKVFLKKSLLLNSNCLSSLSGGGQLKDLSLITVLDISSNKFVSLPKDIIFLKNLQEFYISNNLLNTLPDNLCTLASLTILDVSNNKLKELPSNIGNLIVLQTLNIKGNSKLSVLPPSIGQAKRLKCLELDSEHFKYPPEEILDEDVEGLKKWLCNDAGLEYTPSTDSPDFPTASDHNIESKNEYTNEFDVKLWELETIKQKKAQNFLEIERQNEIMQKQEFELALSQKKNREKLLEDITFNQNKFDQKLLKLQKNKELEKFQLIERLIQVEQNIHKSINHLLTINQEPLTHILEIEKEDEERLLTAANAYNENLRKNDILSAMQEILQQESLQFQKIFTEKNAVSKSILEKQIKWEIEITKCLKNQENAKEELKTKLVEDMEFQKAALGTLLERNDARSWSLVQQVAMVEGQLAALTHIELDRRKLEMNEQVNDIAQKRVELSNLLMDLLDQQQIRRSEILSTLENLEKKWDKVSEDYWLNQYHELLSRTPGGILNAQKNLNPKLAEHLLVNGVIHCLPYIARLIQIGCDINNINEVVLIEAGLSSELDRKNILHAFNEFNCNSCSKTQKECSTESEKDLKSVESTSQTPSAPPDIEEQSALSESFTGRSFIAGSLAECVICMDHECEIIFIPCGHIASCNNCSTNILSCPLCRIDIEKIGRAHV